jgi:hypothetical protein
MLRATISLPTPLSPVIRTLASDARNPLDFLLQRHGLGALTVQLHVGLGARAARSAAGARRRRLHPSLADKPFDKLPMFGVIARNCAAMR